ncbi:hypothetical protein ACFTXM_00185 [Streptomyces sp. NPDC056930]|uniref:hypothetical protein n=1 Tax=unclassified Streptomyces TaxID=2593676 RepID=UPI002E12A63A|nr:hypothetical protein OG609_26420 [Streptomyces sp. NBC_01224]
MAGTAYDPPRAVPISASAGGGQDSTDGLSSSMQVWTNSTWIRVDFGQDGGRVVSVFCTWNDHPPQVEVV